MSCIFWAFALLWGQLQWQLCLKMPCKGFLRATRQMRKMLNLWLQKGNQACGIPCRQCWPITFTMSTREGSGMQPFLFPVPCLPEKQRPTQALLKKTNKRFYRCDCNRNSERKTERDHRDPCVVLLANSLNPVETFPWFVYMGCFMMFQTGRSVSLVIWAFEGLELPATAPLALPSSTASEFGKFIWQQASRRKLITSTKQDDLSLMIHDISFFWDILNIDFLVIQEIFVKKTHSKKFARPTLEPMPPETATPREEGFSEAPEPAAPLADLGPLALAAGAPVGAPRNATPPAASERLDRPGPPPPSAAISEFHSRSWSHFKAKSWGSKDIDPGYCLICRNAWWYIIFWYMFWCSLQNSDEVSEMYLRDSENLTVRICLPFNLESSKRLYMFGP